MYCRTCKRLSPSGSLYCSTCPGRKSFNGIICSNGHRCSAGTVTCPQCGNSEFSEYVRGIRTDWIAKAASVAVLIALWKVSLAHYDRILLVLGSGVAYGFGILTNSDSRALGNVLLTAFALGVAGWGLGLYLYFLPGQGGPIGKFLRGIPVRIFLFALKTVPDLLKRLCKVVLAFAGLSDNKPSKPRGGKGE